MAQIGIKYHMTELVSMLSRFVDDEEHARWTREQKKEAINSAIESSWPSWFEELTFNVTEFYTEGKYRYIIPFIAGCDEIVNVYLSSPSGDTPRLPLHHWHQEGERFWLEYNFPSYAGCNIEFQVKIRPRPLYEGLEGNDGEQLEDNVPVFRSASANFSSVHAGDILTIYSEGMWRSRIITEVIDSHTLRMHYTLDSSGRAYSGVSWYVNKYTDLYPDYLMHKAAAWLYSLAARRGAGVNVQECMNWMAYHDARAAAALQKNRRSQPVRYRH